MNAVESTLFAILRSALGIRKFYRKVVMHRFRKKLYRLVYGEKYPETFLGSFVLFAKV